MAPAPNLQQLIETIQHDAGSDDELEQLAAASATVTEITETGDAALGYFVDRARAAGKSWVEISGVLGVSKQAVHKRFAPTDFAKHSLTRFTDRARNVVEAAPAVAVEAKHHYVGTEHLLLALYVEPDSVATKVLVAAGLTKDNVRAAVLEQFPLGTEIVETEPPFTPRAKEALHLALSEALKLGHNYIGTEHMLLGLYRNADGIAYKVLTELGMDAASARDALVEALVGFQKKKK